MDDRQEFENWLHRKRLFFEYLNEDGRREFVEMIETMMISSDPMRRCLHALFTAHPIEYESKVQHIRNVFESESTPVFGEKEVTALVSSNSPSETITVSAFVAELREISSEIVTQFLACIEHNLLIKDVLQCLTRLSRNTWIVSGRIPVSHEGISSGAQIFRIESKRECVLASDFKNHVIRFVRGLEQMKLFLASKTIPLADSTTILKRLESVDFPDGKTYKNGPVYSQEKARQPAVNVRELHNRKLCTVCRHYLRGLCLRGETCNFCHDRSHQLELEKQA